MAILLAFALILATLCIGVALIANVVEHQNPAATLGENTTQVLTSAIGGVVGILGAYVGYSFRRRHDEADTPSE